MFVNSITFIVSVFHNIQFRTVEPLSGTKDNHLLCAVKNIRNRYGQEGFKVEWILMDSQFETLQGEIANLGICLNEVAEDKHMGKVEQYIRTIKEQCWSTCTVLPFKRLPGQMVIKMVHFAVFWLNVFPGDGNTQSLIYYNW